MKQHIILSSKQDKSYIITPYQQRYNMNIKSLFKISDVEHLSAIVSAPYSIPRIYTYIFLNSHAKYKRAKYSIRLLPIITAKLNSNGSGSHVVKSSLDTYISKVKANLELSDSTNITYEYYIPDKLIRDALDAGICKEDRKYYLLPITGLNGMIINYNIDTFTAFEQLNQSKKLDEFEQLLPGFSYGNIINNVYPCYWLYSANMYKTPRSHKELVAIRINNNKKRLANLAVCINKYYLYVTDIVCNLNNINSDIIVNPSNLDTHTINFFRKLVKPYLNYELANLRAFHEYIEAEELLRTF